MWQEHFHKNIAFKYKLTDHTYSLSVYFISALREGTVSVKCGNRDEIEPPNECNSSFTSSSSNKNVNIGIYYKII